MKDEAELTSRASGGSAFRLPPSALLAYAAFLACSWTWVIGMFLPVVLARDFGFAGWVVFTVPNIVGAAAMGWVLRSPAESDRLVARHGPAVVGFSLVTICFHVYFLGWFLPRLVGTWAVAGLGVVIAAALAARWAPARDSGGVPRRVWAAAGVFALSLACFAYLLAAGPTLPMRPTIDWPDLAGLALVCTFGFGLCPYLDVTFHEARRATGRRSGLAFGLGFGGFFLAMLLFTLCYSGAIYGAALGSALAWVLTVHLVGQSTYTVWVHVRALGGRPGADESRGGWLPAALSAACVVGVVASSVALQIERGNYRLGGPAGLSAGEVVYRSFMGFYGLAFPAYVWLCVAGLRGRPPSALRLAATAVAVALAVPFYALAFLLRFEAWAGVALLVIVAAKVLVTVVERDA